ncbi:hypothetical protein JOC85_000374 [Bacillus mesophilus]|uniref:DUF4878 domain-containing protein n=1 Tax=Bacillus mesophilus TaxID=1808955 RepID=A0A6M0Q2F2_9BACI|nr:hypothetical protein [Bacillus mesophilus]MBM7659607.1 hypothetical protein [Bacillus mesophilus]NEY70476.1 hypothetical protein [Bacillus mesophilus]
MKKNWLLAMVSFLFVLVLVGCGGGGEDAGATAGEAATTDSIEGTVAIYVNGINTEDTDTVLKALHPFSSQHVTLRGYYDNDFAQYDYDVEQVSMNVLEETDSSAVVELVISKTLVEEKGEGKNELTEGEITQKLTFKTKGDEWLIDKVE